MADASLSVASSAVLYGLSVYTVFPVCQTPSGLAAFRLGDHFERLLNSAKIMGIDQFEKEWTFGKFREAARAVIGANSVTDDVLVRATVHVNEILPGVRSRGLTTIVSMFVYETEPILPQTGTRLKTSLWQRVPDTAIPSRAKVNGAYVNSVLGKQDALDSGYDDCLFLDSGGHVCELSAANIFAVREGMLLVPSVASDILEGITRRSVITYAKDSGIPVLERPVDLTELYVADEAFACGSSALVAPVLEIDKRQIGKGVGPLTTQLRDLHVKVLHGEAPSYASLLTSI